MKTIKQQTRKTARLWFAGLLVGVVLHALASVASADHSELELVSTGPGGGNGAVAATFRGGSEDGSRVFFETAEQIVAADTDSSIDIYERFGPTTALVSAGTIGGNGGFDASFEGSSVDGTHVFFTTQEPLVVGDSDAGTDVYERFGAETLLVSTGPAGTTGNFSTFYGGASEDGTHVFFETFEPLVSEDTDAAFRDVYERSGGQTTLVSTGPGSGAPFNPALDRIPNASFAGTSADGSRIFFETPERLAGDGDRFIDLYERSGGATQLISSNLQGSDADFDASSGDGTRVVFHGTNGNLYRFSQGQITVVISGGPWSFGDASSDGSRVFFETSRQLVPEDTDCEFSCDDVYEWSDGTTRLVSIGPTEEGGLFRANFAGAAEDGSRVFFETAEKLVGADTDSSIDSYERAGETTTLVSTGPAGGNGPFAADFGGSSTDGTRAFFETSESLVGSDDDSATDLYERFAGQTTLLSTGPAGGNGALPAAFGGSSGDGERVFLHTSESLLGVDSDASQDVYAAQLAADLSLTKVASPDQVRVGESVTYTLEVTNNGPSNALGVTLTDLLPKSVRLRSARSDHGRCTQRRPRLVACNLAGLSSGETATVTIVVRPTRRGTIVNTATVRASQPIDPSPANNTAIATTTVVG